MGVPHSKENKMLRFSHADDNGKLRKLTPYLKRCLSGIGVHVKNPQFYTFSKLSGHTCPYAKLCHSKAIESGNTRRIEDGKYTQFRCFSASQEVIFKETYKQRKHNTEVMRDIVAKQDLTAIIDAIPSDCNILRIHIAGDFTIQDEFDLWASAAHNCPNILFYAYTKSLPFWVKRLGKLADNFVLTASQGGYKDDLIDKYGLRYAKVVYSKAEAKRLGLPIDHNDFYAANPLNRDVNFALLLHGIQPKGSEAAEALKKLRKKRK
jgi:hypothetical protein